jgi:hypothetical protein
MRRLLAAILLGLSAVAVQGCASDAAATRADSSTDAAAGCPKGNSAGNEERFITRSWFDLFVLQRANKGDIQVTLDLADGTSQVRVRLHDITTGDKTPEQLFDAQHPSQNFTVGCGSWMVQVNSSGWDKASANVSAAPL